MIFLTPHLSCIVLWMPLLMELSTRINSMIFAQVSSA
uniref:Uncharacterized protein n=1 Tax=Rhizophora mucronata TaxID=61149 RepID=A0A2P2IK72_RHIMU